MAVINRRQLEVFAGDVLLHVEFNPVGNREDAHIFAFRAACCCTATTAGALRLLDPLSELRRGTRKSVSWRGLFLRRAARRPSASKRLPLMLSNKVTACAALRESVFA